MNSDTSVIILAAGFSSRMKQAKFALMFDQQRTFLEKIIQEYANFNCSEIIVVLNSDGISLLHQLQIEFPKTLKIIENKHPERERFYSLQTGLKALKNKGYTFLQNSDNPFVNQDILNVLYRDKEHGDYIVPTYSGKGGHPILMNQTISDFIISEKNDHSNLKELLKNFNKYTTEVRSETIILNINTHEQYLKYFKS